MPPYRRDLAMCASARGGEFITASTDVVALPGVVPRGLFQKAPLPAAARALYRLKLGGDRLAAVVLLLVLSPLLLLIAVAIRLESPGPALFAQERIGYRERRFHCRKFRTMYHHLRDPLAVLQATRDDHRVTALGRLLRRTSLDELPQLLNVLRGEMSLVGPRPHAPETRAGGKCFAEIVPAYHQRHEVVPGITGWAQVSGWRGETRTEDDITMRVQYDLDYINGWSPLFDLRILALTLVRMFHDDTAV